MVLNIRLTTDKVPEVFAVFEIVLKDGTVVKTNAVLDKLERVVARYIYRGAEDLRAYDVKDVVYDGSECTPNQHVMGTSLFTRLRLMSTTRAGLGRVRKLW
jgi:hypothetical protein